METVESKKLESKSLTKATSRKRSESGSNLWKLTCKENISNLEKVQIDKKYSGKSKRTTERSKDSIGDLYNRNVKAPHESRKVKEQEDRKSESVNNEKTKKKKKKNQESIIQQSSAESRNHSKIKAYNGKSDINVLKNVEIRTTIRPRRSKTYIINDEREHNPLQRNTYSINKIRHPRHSQIKRGRSKKMVQSTKDFPKSCEKINLENRIESNVKVSSTTRWKSNSKSEDPKTVENISSTKKISNEIPSRHNEFYKAISVGTQVPFKGHLTEFRKKKKSALPEEKERAFSKERRTLYQDKTSPSMKFVPETSEPVIKLKRLLSDPGSNKGFLWSPTEIRPKNKNISNTSIPSNGRNSYSEDFEQFSFWKVLPPESKPTWITKLYQLRRLWSTIIEPTVSQNRPTSMKDKLQKCQLKNPLGTRRPSDGPHHVNVPTEWSTVNIEPSIDQKRIDITNWIESVTLSRLVHSSDRDFELDHIQDSGGLICKYEVVSCQSQSASATAESKGNRVSEDEKPKSHENGMKKDSLKDKKKKSVFILQIPRRAPKVPIICEKPMCFSLTDYTSSKSKVSKPKVRSTSLKVNSFSSRRSYTLKDRVVKNVENLNVMIPFLSHPSPGKVILSNGGLLDKIQYEKVIESMQFKETEGLTLVLVGTESKESEKELTCFDYEKGRKCENQIFIIGFVKDEDITNVDSKILPSNPVILELAEPSRRFVRKHKCNLFVEEAKWVGKVVRRPSLRRIGLLEYGKYIHAKGLLTQNKKDDGDTNSDSVKYETLEELGDVDNCDSQCDSSFETTVEWRSKFWVLSVSAVAFCVFLGIVVFNNVMFAL